MQLVEGRFLLKIELPPPPPPPPASTQSTSIFCRVNISLSHIYVFNQCLKDQEDNLSPQISETSSSFGGRLASLDAWFVQCFCFEEHRQKH